MAGDDSTGPDRNDPVDPVPGASVRVITGRMLGVVSGASAARGQSEDDEQRAEILIPAVLTVASQTEPGSPLESMGIEFSVVHRAQSLPQS